jgi:hypothetical protein
MGGLDAKDPTGSFVRDRLVTGFEPSYSASMNGYR